MTFDRRQFLKTTAAGAALLLPGTRAFAAAAPIDLVPGVARQAVIEGGPATEVWAFNGTTPGPQFRFKQGEDVFMRVRNRLPRSTTVHWHGIRVPNAMDGVPNVTQEVIAPGGGFNYRFTCVDSGTYWYHPHQSSFEQVPRGLYGAFIIEEEKPTPVDREVVWVLSDFKLDANNAPVEDFGRILDFGSGGRLGNKLAIDGTLAGAHRRLELKPNERIRLRLVNASSARIFRLEFTGHQPWILALDGQGIPPVPLTGPLVLGCGQRTDLIVDGTAERGEFAINDKRDEGARLATIAYAGSPARAKPLARPEALAPNRLVEPNLAEATRHYLIFEGGVLGAPAIGKVDGKALDVKSIMAQHGLTWTMNYTAQHEHAMMHEPLFRFRKGEHTVVKMLNHTEFEHPMHLHGHFFKVVAVDGKRVEQPVWRDTVMMGPREEIDVAFVADNVGEWMFHCHILDHAAGGMMGTIAVEE